MKVEVLHVKETGKGFNVAHVRAGNLFGDCLTAPDVVEPGEYWLKGTLQVREGRLVSLIRVERQG